MKKITTLCLLICLVCRIFAGSHNNSGAKTMQTDCSATITVSVSWSSICPGSSVTITASGGATYLWNDGETTSTISVSPGSSTLYMVTGTDTGGCTGTATSMVNVDNFFVNESYAYSPTCDGLPIVFTSTIDGGITPFTYYWQADGSTGAADTITNYSNTAYDYSLFVTDSLGCHSQSESPFIPRYEFYAYLPDSAQYCNDYGDPKANVLCPTIVNGKGPYTFYWNTGDSTQAISPNAPGLYAVIITDGWGCSQTFSCHVTFPAAPVVMVTASSNNITPGAADTLTASGAEKYYWSNGMTSNKIIVHPLQNCSYSVYGWDTTVLHVWTLGGSAGVGSTIPISTNGCGSPWEGVPIIVANSLWKPSLSTPYTDTSSIYTLGNVGIGLQVPNYKLEVNGTVAADSTLLIGKVNTGQGIRINGDSATITSPTKTVSFGNDTVVTTGTMKAGREIIGSGITTPGNYGLYVANGILTSLVKVALPTDTDWSDYVFENTYNLKTLYEVAQYIKANKHLPEVPSAKDVQKSGIDLAKMDATLLKKIEELTLYNIEQQKELDELKTKLEALEKKQK